MELINAEQITYRYKNPENEENGLFDPALNQASLRIQEGEYICILGRNGSGKSTLARHLNAILIPDAGICRIGGMDSRDKEHIWEIRRLAGMVFQNPDNQMVAGTLEEEVAFGPENLGMEPAEIRKAVFQALETTGLSDLGSSSPTALSGGQKQRLAIAGILAMNPRCLILDEATSMLDPAGREEILQAVRSLVRQRHITVIHITHSMEEALDADRIYIMKDGRIVKTGTPVEVFSDTETLLAAGLRLPVICRVADLLRKKGIPLPEGITKEEELAAAIQKLFEAGHLNENFPG